MPRKRLHKGNLAAVRNVRGDSRLRPQREVGRVLAPEVRDVGVALVSAVDGIAVVVVVGEDAARDAVPVRIDITNPTRRT